MLLEFRTSNYKSFVEELVFSMVPAPRQTGLDYSILKEMIGKKEYRALSSAVIYGPNAAGKTNIIGAIDTFKNIVLRGHIRNSDDRKTPNAAANSLELIPNSTLESPLPVTFNIKFTAEDMLFEYGFSMDIGEFLDRKYSRKIISEKLLVNNKIVFEREDVLKINNLDIINNYLLNSFENNKEAIVSLSSNNLNDEELFLMNGFRTMYSSKIVSMISSWLDEKLIVIYRADAVEIQGISEINQSRSELEKDRVVVERTVNEAAQSFGINSNAIGYVYTRDSESGKLCSLFGDKTEGTAIPAELFESYGTIRFINIFPLVLSAFVNGATLLIDEFDASLHPMALMNIINIFHNDEININNAQLVFNTHNPIFLNSNLYRRDEIKFVERNDVTHLSTHYSLSDFGTSGTISVRKDEDYMNNYFIDKYGAIKDIDFSELFERLINND